MNRLARLATLVVLALGGFATSNVASADVSYNIGFASEYYYRGILQKSSSASAGVDFETGGFYVGAWTADVGDGVEIDGYLGWGFETESGFSASIGATGYYYTGDFDDTYEEINLNLGYNIFSLEYSVGEWDGNGAPMDYDFLAGTVTLDSGFYGTVGTFGDDFDGEYFEVGYGTTIAELDVGVALIYSSEELSDQADESEAVVFTIGKTF
jgi:uncharacterized protein (TIGR02001 family)